MHPPVSKMSEPSFSAPSFGVEIRSAVVHLWTSLRIRARLTLPESHRQARRFLNLLHCSCLAWPQAASSWAEHILVSNAGGSTNASMQPRISQIDFCEIGGIRG